MVLLEIAVEEKLSLEFVGTEEIRRVVMIGPRSKPMAFWVTARGPWEARAGEGAPRLLGTGTPLSRKQLVGTLSVIEKTEDGGLRHSPLSR